MTKRKQKHKKKVTTPLGYDTPSLQQVNFYNLMGSIAHGTAKAGAGVNAVHHQWSSMTAGDLKDFLAELRHNSLLTAELALILFSHLPDDDKEKVPQVTDRDDSLLKFGASRMKKRMADHRTTDTTKPEPESLIKAVKFSGS